MPIMPEIPEMSIILTRGIDGSVFSDGLDRSEEGWRIRKETKGFRRDLRGDLEKKGCKKGVVSL